MSRALLEVLLAMLGAAKNILEDGAASAGPGAGGGAAALDSAGDGGAADRVEMAARRMEGAIGKSFLARVLCYALDAAYQMPVHQLMWAKLLLPALHRLASTRTLLALSSYGASAFMPSRRVSTTPNHPPTPSHGSSSSGKSAAVDTPVDVTDAADGDAEGSADAIADADAEDSSEEVALLESPHPLPAEPEDYSRTVAIAGATHLCLTFDHRCATHSTDVLRVQLPAPPLPDGWSLEMSSPHSPPCRRPTPSRPKPE